MKYRFSTSKNSKNSVMTKTNLKGSIPVYTGIVAQNLTDDTEYPVNLHIGIEKKVEESQAMLNGKLQLRNDALLSSICFSQGGEKNIPLSMQFDYRTGESLNQIDKNASLAEKYGRGIGIWDYINKTEVKELMLKTAISMFPNDVDIQSGGSYFYSHLIPIACVSGAITTQFDKDGNSMFNAGGTVSVAEFLDSLNAIKHGTSSKSGRKLSLDNTSDVDDYFNEGYNSCLGGVSSPFYRLYSRRELGKPITRLELAYITVICWSEFAEKFGSAYGGRYSLGFNVNWNSPSEYVSEFSDGFDYKVYKKVTKDEYKVPLINIKEYSKDKMSEFLGSMRAGVKGIPLPMFMSLIELRALDLFYFEGNKLSPLKEVTRGELTYFVTKLAKEFPMKFISGDKTY